MEICDKDTSKLFMFNDKEDVDSIQHFQSLLGHEPKGGATRYSSGVASCTVWFLKTRTRRRRNGHFSSLNRALLNRFQCLERSADKTTCHKCHDIRCGICDLQQDLPECPVCREFDLEAYCRNNRTIYLNQIDADAGW